MDARSPDVKLRKEAQAELNRWIQARTLPVRQGVRAQVILLAAEGTDEPALALDQGISRQRCGRIRSRFLEGRNQASKTDRSRWGRPRVIETQKIVAFTTSVTRDLATDWCLTLMPKAAGLSPSNGGRVWRNHGLKRHRASSLKKSATPLSSRINWRRLSGSAASRSTGSAEPSL
jgi:hypothetical protein